MVLAPADPAIKSVPPILDTPMVNNRIVERKFFFQANWTDSAIFLTGSTSSTLKASTTDWMATPRIASFQLSVQLDALPRQCDDNLILSACRLFAKKLAIFYVMYAQAVYLK